MHTQDPEPKQSQDEDPCWEEPGWSTEIMMGEVKTQVDGRDGQHWRTRRSRQSDKKLRWSQVSGELRRSRREGGSQWEAVRGLEVHGSGSLRWSRSDEFAWWSQKDDGLRWRRGSEGARWSWQAVGPRWSTGIGPRWRWQSGIKWIPHDKIKSSKSALHTF